MATNQITNNVTNPNDPMLQDFLVTQAVDPNAISQDQLQKDLELLKKQDLLMKSRPDTPLIQKVKKVQPKVFQPMNITEVDVLKLKNPFRGE